MKVSQDFSGALSTFAYFIASGTHYMLQDIEYIDLFGTEPSAIEMVFAIFANVLEMDEEGKVLNFTYAQKKATDYLKSYCSEYIVDPPFEEWETTLYGPPKRDR